MKKVFSVLLSIVFSIVIILFIAGISLRVYNINDFNNMIMLINNDLNIKLIDNLDIIYKQEFMNISFIIFTIIFILICLVNIKNKFYNSLKYTGSSMIISGAFMLIGGLFFDKITPSLDKNVAIILNSNRLGFLKSLNHKCLIFLMSGFILIILYSIIDTLYEKYKNKKLIESNVEIIEE